MKILLISNLFPPFILGGAEMAADSLATWLARHGHEVCVLTSAPQPAQVGSFRTAEGVQIERRYFPNSYSVYDMGSRSPWEKMVWHWRDHYNPEAETICREVIEEFKPEIVNTHDLQGIGYNLLREIGRQRLPCVQVLHDYGFLCLAMSLFRNGRTCTSRHLPCLASGWVKRRYLASIERLSFWSPSRALLDSYRPDLPKYLEAVAIPLPLTFTPPSAPRSRTGPSGQMQLLYVGQIVPWKGIEFILRVLASLASSFDFQLTIVGGGAQLKDLEEKYGQTPWVKLAGRVRPEQVADFMTGSDLLLIPSLWFENSPLVAYQARQLHLPILASEVGGLPELVFDNINGRLLPAGDYERWRETIAGYLADPKRLDSLRKKDDGLKDSLDQDVLGQRVLALFARTIGGMPPGTPSATREDFHEVVTS